MNSGDRKTYKCVKISKSHFFMITIFPLHDLCSESKKENDKIENEVICKHSANELDKKESSFFIK